MNYEETLKSIIEDLPKGGELFLPFEVAEHMFGTGDQATIRVDEICTDCGCSLAHRQSLQSTPDEEGFRIIKTA